MSVLRISSLARRAIARILLVIAFVSSAATARAECDVDYLTQPGDSLFGIAEKHYGDVDKWALIFYANQDALSGKFLQIAPGTKLFIPCSSTNTAADATPLRQSSAQMTLLTGGDYAPFTDQDWQGGGMVTELLNAALELAPDPVPYSITWEDDWSKHLFPLLDEKRYDMGFPWLKPDCATTPDNERCANFHFSDPLFVLPIMLFTKVKGGMTYERESDVLGKTLCRPKGYFTHDLDRAGRRWLSDGKITLVQPDSPEACFEQLMAGKVDAVTVNLFLGVTKIVEMGLRGQVSAPERPVSEEALHVIISKRHWRGTTLLYRVNAGLAALKQSGRYDKIVAKHLTLFWDQLNG